MTDNIELMPCVCGLEDEEENLQINKMNGYYFVECQIVTCSCSTSKNTYTTPEQSATAWNTMQHTLQSGWTKKLPTEEGYYWFYDISLKDMVICHLFYREEDSKLEVKFLDVLPSLAIDDIIDGLWYRINYPEPPKLSND